MRNSERSLVKPRKAVTPIGTDEKNVNVMIEGLAAGREPRAAAEELRQLLLEQLGQTYHNVNIEFKTLEDLDTLAKIGGTNMATARFALSATFNPSATAKAASPASKSPKK